MSLDKKDVAKVARLARIKMDDNELEQLVPKLSNIIDFVEQLAEVNTDNVKPLASVIDIAIELREDKVNDAGYPEKILANAPEKSQNYFVVPNAIEDKK